MRRTFLSSLIILSAVILQTTLFAKLTLFGVSPDIILVVVICFALVEGISAGTVAGFAGGLLRDLLLNGPRGITGLAYMIVGYLTGSIRPYVLSTSMAVPIAAIFAGSLAGSLLYVVLAGLLGQALEAVGRELQVGLLTAVYNMLLAPLVYPVVRKVVLLDRKETLYR